MSKTPANANIVINDDFGQTGKFVRENQKSLVFIASAIVAMIIIYVIYQKLYLGPREDKATNQMYVAQDFWAKKDWDKAINGDAGYPGFEKIVADYSNTKAANIAYYCLGVAYLNKGEYQKAINDFNEYRGDDNMVAAEAYGSTGDAYVELKDFDKAATYFKKAIDKSKNRFLSPIYLKKLGLVYEEQKDFKAADEAYKSIKTDYSESAEAQNADEYIARVEAHL